MFFNKTNPYSLTAQNSYSRIRQSIGLAVPSLDHTTFKLQQDFLAVEDQKRYFQNRLNEHQRQSLAQQQSLLRKLAQKNELIILLEERSQRLEKQLRLKTTEIEHLLSEQSSFKVKFQEEMNKVRIKHEYQLQELRDQLEKRHAVEKERALRQNQKKHLQKIQYLNSQIAVLQQRIKNTDQELSNLTQNYFDLSIKKDHEMRALLNKELTVRMREEEERFKHDSALRQSIRSQNKQLKDQIVDSQKRLAQLNQANKQLRGKVETLQFWEQERKNKQQKLASLEIPPKETFNQQTLQNNASFSPGPSQYNQKDIIVVPINNDKKMMEAVCGLIHYTRKSLSDVLQKMFSQSSAIGLKRKTHSLSIFTTSFKELKENQSRTLCQLQFVLKKLKNIVSEYYPSDSYKYMVRPKLNVQKGVLRNNFSQFVEKSLLQIYHKASHQKLQKLAAVNSLHRIVNPTSHENGETDLDLRVSVEDMIAQCLEAGLQPQLK